MPRTYSARKIQDPLKSWLIQRGFWVFAGTRTDDHLSHVFLDGGKACVPPSAIETFFSVYSEAVLSGNVMHVVECAPKSRMKMFLDVDAKHLPTCDALGFASILDFEKAIAKRIIEIAHHNIDDLGGNAVVCLKHAKNSHLCGFVGGGIHIVWTDNSMAIKDAEGALALRNRLVSLLNDDEQNVRWGVNWSEAIDSAVYNNCSLRLIFSHKRNSLGEYYVPTLEFVAHSYDKVIVMRNVEFEEVVENLQDWVSRTSILPLQYRETVVSGQVDTDIQVDKWNNGSDAAAHERHCNATLRDCGIDPDLVKLLKKELPPPYDLDECCITNVRTYELPDGTLSYTLTTNSRYCMNLERSHSSNRVYFVANKNGVFQRCFCRCETSEGRKFGKCSELNYPLCSSHPFPSENKKEEDESSKIKNNKRPTKMSAAESIKVLRQPHHVSVADAWLAKLLNSQAGQTNTKKMDSKHHRRR